MRPLPLLLTALALSCLLLAQPARADPPPAGAPAQRRAAPRSQPGPTLQAKRSGHKAMRLADGRVLILGGTSEPKSDPGLEIYDPLVGMFQSVYGSEGELSGTVHASTLTDGRVLIVRGRSSWLFDPRTDRLTREPIGLGLRHGAEVGGTFATGEVLLARSNTLRLLDPQAKKGTDLPGFKKFHTYQSTLTSLRGGSVLLLAAGGKSPDKSTARAHVITPQGARRVADLNKERDGHAALALDDDALVVAGGRKTRMFRRWRSVREVEVFDLRTERWTTVGETQHDRYGVTLVRRGDEVLLVGGRNRKQAWNTIEVFSAKARRLEPRTYRMERERAFATATLLEDGRVLIVGGEHGGGWFRKPKATATTELLTWPGAPASQDASARSTSR